MKIVITDSDTITTGDISFSCFAKYGTVIRYGLTELERIVERLRDADVLLCNKTRITREIIEKLPDLKYIGLFATGYNNIDLESASEHGIVVSNAPDYSTEGVAQLVFSLIFELYGNLSKYKSYTERGDWKKSAVFSSFPYPIFSVAGKTIGIIGYGAIGRYVAKIADAFGMRVIVTSRTQKADCPYTFTDMDTLLRESDIVTLHCPLNKDSENLINRETIAKMKDGAVLINTSRGPVVDEKALREALLSGKLMGAGLDVLCTEPMADDCPLFGVPNCIITPHIGWAAIEIRTKLMGIVENNLKAFLDGNPINKVNR